jgi:spore germination protein
MHIHVVKSGDSIWGISRRYGISSEAIVEANQLSKPDRLVVGQTLVIPTTQDSRQGQKPTVETSAYIDPRITRRRSAQAIDRVGDWLTYVTIFSYAVNRDGSLTPVEDEPSIEAALRHRVAPLLVLTNLENGQFNTELATLILTQEAIQDRILDEALRVMQMKGYRGLDFDFEYLGAENRERYVRFLSKASERVKPLGYTLSAALAPKYSETQRGVLYEGHDYEAIGRVVDFMFIMTYEWGWSGGPPQAVSPIGLMRRVLDYAVTAVPRQKIMMGIPLYGYDWTLPYVPRGKYAKAISPQRGIELASQYGQSIQYDQTSQAPWFRYTDEQGRRHEVWFEDARSIQAKFNLVKEYGLRGFYFWVLGHEFPQVWLLIQDNFIIRKRI